MASEDKGSNEEIRGTARSKFEQATEGQTQVSLPRELLGFLANNKKWWLLPVLVTFLGIGVLVMLSSTAAAPFIYTFF